LRALATAEQGNANARLRAERLCCLAGVYFEKTQWQQCKDLLNKAVEAYQAEFGQHSCYSRLCSMALAAVAKREGKNGEADELFERSRTDVSATDADTGGEDRAVLELIQGFYAQGRMSEVEMLLAQTILCDEQHLWPHHPRVATALQLRADLFRAQGRFEDAERAYKQALEIRMQVLGPAHPEVAETAMSMATMYMSQNRFADAEPTLKIALKTRVLAFGVENPGVAACVETYASLLKRTKRGAIAMKLEARARDIRTRLVWKADKASASNNLPLV
jgi:tetratricopeptide (TPR) repeat protein